MTGKTWINNLAIAGVFMNMYLFCSSQYISGAFHTAIWQPSVPLVVTIITLILGFESKSVYKVK
jgi:hypothetical protein